MVYIILRRMIQAFILLLVTLIIVIVVSCFAPKEIKFAEGIETDRLVWELVSIDGWYSGREYQRIIFLS